ncbi:MAG: cytochrome c3 family protein [Candidatus Bipolaricaulia bacterium]
MDVIRRWRRTSWLLRLLWIAIVLLPLGVAAAFVGIEVSSQPGFCGTCHVMAPYYESWKTSSHDDVKCVECHIPPGITNELRKKFEASSMVVSYFTGTYGTKPWAEVPDASCLRPGCHEQRLLSGREVYENVVFDHQDHLTEMRRGKELRCTSCHSQIVQGKHIAVTKSTCFLCHFKDQPINHGTATCTLCHDVPEKTVTTGGLKFDHGDVKRYDMNCANCHSGVVQGQGNVPESRCVSCHNKPARLQRYEETQFLHEKHVTEHKVECLQCHNEIQHESSERLKHAEGNCATCHADGGHSPQRDLYVGLGAKDVEPRASKMYLAGVRCESCHILTEGDRKVASSISCMSCHGADFKPVYANWTDTMKRRLDRLKAERKRVASQVPDSSEAYQRANANIDFVERARAIHNPRYASDILERAHQDLRQALQSASASVPTQLKLPPWPEVNYKTDCIGCHLDAAGEVVPTDRGPFRHKPHAVDGGVNCTTCHQSASYQQSSHGNVARSCASCHPSQPTMAQASTVDCQGCHAEPIEVTSDEAQFSHNGHVQSAGVDCTECHTSVPETDHLELMKRAPEDALPTLDHELCQDCHDGVPPVEGSSVQPCLMCHPDFEQ